jgi:SAM-dependent MidA family methyltransferase
MWILGEIERRGGEVSFRTFMELALYHPVHGFYTSGPVRVGRDGDFLTAPSSSSWYGEVVARWLKRLALRAGGPLVLVDLASGDGRFLGAVIGALADDAARVLSRVVAIDRAPAQRGRTARRLAGAPIPVVTADECPVVDDSPTVAHASELYDAMPVHRVEQGADRLLELAVAVRNGGLEWCRRPAPPALRAYLEAHGVGLEAGQRAELNLDAESFHGSVLERLGAGLVLTLDYGYPARRLYDPRGRRRGSLATYRRHELGSNPLDAPGQRDLTAHVNWDDLRRAAAACGWREIGLVPLAELLVRAGLGELIEERGLGLDAELDAATVAARQELKQLLDPEGMGSDLKVLVQGRGALADAAAEIFENDP